MSLWDLGTADKLTSREDEGPREDEASSLDLHILFSEYSFIKKTRVFYKKLHLSKIYAKLHPGPEWRIFNILMTFGDIDDVISRFFTVVSANSK